MQITLVVAGRLIPGFAGLADSISKKFHSHISAEFIDFPFTRSFRSSRKQHDADVLLAELSRGRGQGGKAVFIIHEDMFSKPNDFVFGLAKGDCAVVSTARLDPRRYGPAADLKKAGALFHERILKEAMHELGHLCGLPHCDDGKCVMSFSESVGGVDSKGPDFCGRCRLALYLND